MSELLSPKSKKKIKMTQEQLEQISPTLRKEKKLRDGSLGSPTGLRSELRENRPELKFERKDKKRGSVGAANSSLENSSLLVKLIPTEPDFETAVK